MAGAAFVKNVGTAHANAATVSVTVPAAGVAAGDFLAVAVASASNAQVSTVTDSRGNLYARRAPAATQATLTAELFTCKLKTALLSGDLISVNYGAAHDACVIVDEFSGVEDSFDRAEVATGVATPLLPAAFVTSNPSDLIYYVMAANPLGTLTGLPTGSADAGPINGAAVTLYAAHRLIAAALTRVSSDDGAPTWGGAETQAVVVASFAWSEAGRDGGALVKPIWLQRLETPIPEAKIPARPEVRFTYIRADLLQMYLAGDLEEDELTLLMTL